MKLFQWVHRKFRQNSIEPFKDFTFGNPCNCLTVQPTLDELYSHAKPNFRSINQSRFLNPNKHESQTSHSDFEDDRDEEKFQEETSAVISDLFQGFLTIGTLGAETVTNEPATPTFPMPLENITERSEEVTENDLKLINYELEKFLEAEKERFNESSGRNSHVSTITLSGKQMDGAEDEDYGNTSVCPLQGYLLGSSIELPETTEVRKERASLAELFHRTKITNQDALETDESGESQFKQTHKSSMHIMKKMLKKVHTSSRSCTTSEGDPNPASINKKLFKVLHMFHRKVYPENSVSAKEIIASQKGTTTNVPHDFCNGYDTGDPTFPDKGRKYCSEFKSRKWSQNCKKNSNPPQHELSYSSSSGNREHWIKTDEECKLGAGAVATEAARN
ncbi:protein LAZY 1-like [Senna tora]|uniref:Protein LAZY 1-like n=1 Tax=Senna tora TaxID=362788 RepID=A0A834SG40_9FABA|nr:protein LAZY 1-like [Senna tora]